MTLEFLSPNGVFAFVVRSFTLVPLLFATLNPCSLAILLNCGVMLGMFWITTIPRVGCSVSSSVVVRTLSVIASSISSSVYPFSLNTSLTFVSSAFRYSGSQSFLALSEYPLMIPLTFGVVRFLFDGDIGVRFLVRTLN